MTSAIEEWSQYITQCVPKPGSNITKVLDIMRHQVGRDCLVVHGADGYNIYVGSGSYWVKTFIVPYD